MATGFLSRNSAVAASCAMTSEYTRASRTRRAISCAYCAPKSTTRTGRGPSMRSSALAFSAEESVTSAILGPDGAAVARGILRCVMDASTESSARPPSPRPWSLSILDITQAAVFAALIAALGLPGAINLPGGVPITLQTMGVMLAGAILGPKKGTLAVEPSWVWWRP